MTLLLVHAAITLFMTGVIWFVQLVHYPLFATVAEADFVRYEAQHTTRTGLLVVGPMLLELGTAFALLGLRSPVVGFSESLMGLALLGAIWVSTVFVQMPCHRLLGAAYDGRVQRRLVASNWLRTVAWTGRALLVLTWLNRM